MYLKGKKIHKRTDMGNKDKIKSLSNWFLNLSIAFCMHEIKHKADVNTAYTKSENLISTSWAKKIY